MGWPGKKGLRASIAERSVEVDDEVGDGAVGLKSGWGIARRWMPPANDEASSDILGGIMGFGGRWFVKVEKKAISRIKNVASKSC